jgi:hypothetical protein
MSQNPLTPDGKEPACAVRAPRMTTVERTVSDDDLELRRYKPEDAQAIREAVEDIEPPEKLQEVMDAYYEHLDDRAPYQWKWLYGAFTEYQLSCVDEEYREELAVMKTVLGVFNALLDDIAEDNNDRETFWELAKCVHPEVEPNWERPDIDTDAARVAKVMWETIVDTLEDAPRYDEFRDLWLFDIRNALTGMDYSDLTTRHDGLVNEVESWLYDTQNVMTVGLTMVDVMYAPSFEADDLRPLRQMLYRAMEMWRIGNWQMTWRRELVEGDHSAVIVITALAEEIVDKEELTAIEQGELDPEDVIERIEEAGIEDALLAEWVRRRDAILSRADQFDSVDIEAFIEAAEQVLSTQLASQGYTKGTHEE